ncbi:MAG TPA: patatin-like phospholipase family protein [Casimicrobiaceae bacterium]|nr:patatin-like phospholipase family protein [Casimicrobiaceae bacterium]
MIPLLQRLQPRPQTARKSIGLALQGGGSWGAYTWGVLDVILASRRVAIAQLSGTSAGAINAAIVAGALAKGSPVRAREALAAFWRRITAPSLPLSEPVQQAWRETFGVWLLGVVSPYQANPLGIHPLRDAIEAHVDIEAIRSGSAPPLFVTLTNVRTGLPRVISNAEMSVEALLASACLPQLFQAVEIDGEPYWDGAYLGNPALAPMIRSGAASDLVVVQLVPEGPEEAPRDALSIRRRVGEIVFNASLVAEMQAIATLRDATGSRKTAMRDLRLHRIGPPRRELLQQGSTLERSRIWLERLRAEGRAAAKAFIARHAADLGVRETLDIAATFTAPGNDGGAAANEPSYALPSTER